MGSELDLAWIASVVGDPARSRILLALMDGRARTAKELAFLAGIAAPTASGHLAKLLDGRLVAVEPQGRHRYYRLASALVAQMLETTAVVGGEAYAPYPRLRRVDPALAAARTCSGVAAVWPMATTTPAFASFSMNGSAPSVSGASVTILIMPRAASS